MIIKGIFSQHAGKIEQTKYPEIKKEGYINIFVFLASLCAYIILISYTDIPYLALTFIYLFSFGFFLAEYDKKSIIPLFASSSIITVIIYVLFSFFLEVIFP